MEMQITSKGQVTIPKYLRKKYGFRPKSKIDFIEKNGEVVLTAADKNIFNTSSAAKSGRWKKIFDELGVKNSVEYIRVLRGHDKNDPGLPQ